ncbi:MAG: glycoside hydrolase family 43 protein [Prolixibacteraceae bacterium]|jgi:arabinoxylan arabinofuranohydrolase|nr:glycoside hydrolase family 43 protein [Prolixibacteraceae bacterium]
MMKIKLIELLVVVFMVVSLNKSIHAQNPIIQNVYTADPAPMVHNDTLFLFTGHDEDETTEKGFIMKDYLCFSTTDMVNWTQHGAVFSTESLGWAAPQNANAAQVEFRNGKFYFYISPWSALEDGGDCIAVGVADSPYGPYKDALGKPFISNGQTTYSKHPWEDIDPTVLIDDDGQAYMYWGNNSLYCVKLNEDMISYSGEIITFDIKDKEAFGSDYEEAPWIFKRNDTYYLFYAAHIPEAIYYTTSSSPLGPWKYGGVVMKAGAQGCNGNHPGVIQYKGNWYLFYFNQDLPGGHDKKRAINVIPFDFNSDGSISELPHSKAGVIKSVANLNPYIRTEAETMAWEEGIETASNNKKGMYVTDISNGDYIKIRSVDFGKGAKSFEANVASASKGGSIEIHIGGIDGSLLGTCFVTNTGGSQSWEVQSCKVKKVKGIHDVYYVFKGSEGDLFNFDWWKFE